MTWTERAVDAVTTASAGDPPDVVDAFEPLTLDVAPHRWVPSANALRDGALSASDSPGSFAPGQAFTTRDTSTKSLRSGWPSKPSGSSSGSVAPPTKSIPNISCVSRSCQVAPG